MQKGFTYIELLVVLALISLILGIIMTIFKVKEYFTTARDLQRLQDMNLLFSAINFYFLNATSTDPDGPYLDRRGIDESAPTIFISVPTTTNQSIIVSTISGSYYLYLTNFNDYRKINGQGWIPINFYEVNFPALSNLPVDPINKLESNLYYLYAFRRTPPQFEISTALESPKFQKGGLADKVSTDGGNDDDRFELGTNLNITPPTTF